MAAPVLESSCPGEESQRYPKMKGFATTEGQNFEIKMAALLFVRGINCGRDFKLATNVADAGALDDIVFIFRTSDKVWRTCFIQLKHKKSAKLNLDSLINVKGDFALAKYFESFMEVKQLFEKKERSELYEGTFQNCHFILFTNAPLHQGKGGVETRDLSSPVDEYFMLNKVEASFTEHLVDSLYSDLEKLEEKQNKQPRYSISSNKEDAKDFLRRLKLFTGQPSEDQLDEIIKKELQEYCKREGVEYVDLMNGMYVEALKSWWKDSEGIILHRNSRILLQSLHRAQVETKLSLVESLVKEERQKYQLNINFLESATAGIQDTCALHSLVHIVVEGGYRIASTKLLQALRDNDVIFLGAQCLRREAEAVMSVWSHGDKHLLVIVDEDARCDVKRDDICKKFVKVHREDSRKKIMLVSSLGDSLAAKLRASLGPNFKQIEDTFHISQLDQTTIKSVYEKQVAFQEVSATLGAMIGEDEGAASFLKRDILESIIGSTNLSIGQKLSPQVPFFIPRTLVVNDVIKSSIFLEYNSSHKILIKNATLAEVSVFVQPTEERGLIGRFREGVEGLVFESSDGGSSTDIVGSHETSHVHYLEMIENKKLIWKKTEGDITFIKKHIDQSVSRTTHDQDNRVVLVVAEPGMGKSTLLSHVSHQTKQAHPGSWVVSIALNNHTTLLAKTKEEDLTAEMFLSSALGLDKMSALDRALFEYALNHSGNMTVLLDGFDEIAPKYVGKCCALVASVVKTRVKQVWISSRHSMRETLEVQLSTLALTLRKFSADDQRRFLAEYWGTSTKLTEKELDGFITRLLSTTAQSLKDNDNDFTGIPLQTFMLAEVFKDYVNESANRLPEKIDVIYLLEQFVNRKFVVYLKRVYNVDPESVGYVSLHENFLHVFMRDHKIAALMLLYDGADLDALCSRKFAQKSEKFLTNVATGEEKSGIIVKVVDGKPSFLHRVFAEYFAALWFAQHFADVREFLRRNLLVETFGVVRHMLDRILAGDRALHLAVLDSDIGAAESLLRAGADVNEKDNGGRTPLHLVIMSCFTDQSDVETNVAMIRLLMTHEADVEMKDDVLQWTILQCADASKRWAELDALLQHGYKDIAQFNTTKHNIDHQNMWWTVIIFNYANVMSLLLDLGLSVHSRFNNSSSLLHFAADCGSVGIVCVLFDRVTSVGSRRDATGDVMLPASHDADDAMSPVEELLNARDKNGWTALMFSVCRGGGSSSRIEQTFHRVRKILDAFTDAAGKKRYVNAQATDGRSALSIATNSGLIDVVDLLMESGAEATAHEQLIIACKLGRKSAVESLLLPFPDVGDKAIFVNTRDDRDDYALLYPCEKGHVELVELLVRSGADVTVRGKRQWTGLMYASQNGHASVVQVLLDSFTDDGDKVLFINMREPHGESALSLATERIRSDVVDILMKSGADVTPLEQLVIACRLCRKSVVESLLDAFTDARERARFINTPFDGTSALLSACWMGQEDIVDLLIRSGADVTFRGDSGWTGLMRACWLGHKPVIHVLLDSIADPAVKAEYVNVCTDDGRSALWWASHWESHDVIELLVSAGATTERDTT